MTEPTPAASSPDDTVFDTPTGDAPIAVLLSRVMRDVGAVRKASTANVGGGYRFRGVDAVVNAVSPALRRHGVVVLPTVLDVSHELVEARNGGMMRVVDLRVRYTFVGPAGDTLATEVVAESFDAGDKGTAKAMSVALRTAMLQALMLPTDDDDPDYEGFERAQRRPQQPRAERPPAAVEQSPGAQRRQAAEAAATAQPTPLPEPVAVQYRDRILNAVITYPVGADRDAELRRIRDELATMPSALSTPVTVPELWRNGRAAVAPLTALITVARSAPDPNDPTAK